MILLHRYRSLNAPLLVVDLTVAASAAPGQPTGDGSATHPAGSPSAGQ